MYLGKVLVDDAQAPLLAERPGPAGVAHVGALDEHAADDALVLRRRALFAVAVVGREEAGVHLAPSDTFRR